MKRRVQKLLALGVLAVLAGAGLYQARQAAHLRTDLAALQQQQAQGTARLQQLQRERDEATNRLAVPCLRRASPLARGLLVCCGQPSPCWPS